MKKVLVPASGAKPIGPYSPGVEANGLVFISGQVGVNPQTGKLEEGIAAQTARALNNLLLILNEAGLSYNNVVKTTVFLTDIQNFAKMNAEYAKAFTQECPARSAVQVAALPGNGALVEIEAIAIKD